MMEKGTRGEARTRVAASSEKVFALVSDVTRMGEWSPETIRCEWLDGAREAAVGARFKGTNKRGIVRWSTKPTVVSAEPGREFAFTADLLGREMTKWCYRFEAADGGTEVVESFEMMRDLPWYLRLFDRYLLRAPDRKADLETGMARTLERIKTAAEGSTG